MSRRQDIITTAIRCIGQEGLQRTNLNVIAKSLGIRPSNVAYHFPQLDDLLHATVEHIVAINQAIVDPELAKAKSRAAEVRAYLHGNLRWVKQHPDQYAILIAGFMASNRGDELGRLVQAAIQAGVDRLYSLIAKGVVEGDFADLENPKELAEILHHALVGTLTRYYTDQAKQTAPYRQRLDRLVQVLLKLDD